MSLRLAAYSLGFSPPLEVFSKPASWLAETGGIAMTLFGAGKLFYTSIVLDINQAHARRAPATRRAKATRNQYDQPRNSNS